MDHLTREALLQGLDQVLIQVGVLPEAEGDTTDAAHTEEATEKETENTEKLAEVTQEAPAIKAEDAREAEAAEATVQVIRTVDPQHPEIGRKREEVQAKMVRNLLLDHKAPDINQGIRALKRFKHQRLIITG